MAARLGWIGWIGRIGRPAVASSAAPAPAGADRSAPPPGVGRAASRTRSSVATCAPRGRCQAGRHGAGAKRRQPVAPGRHHRDHKHQADRPRAARTGSRAASPGRGQRFCARLRTPTLRPARRWADHKARPAGASVGTGGLGDLRESCQRPVGTRPPLSVSSRRRACIRSGRARPRKPAATAPSRRPGKDARAEGMEPARQRRQRPHRIYQGLRAAEHDRTTRDVLEPHGRPTPAPMPRRAQASRRRSRDRGTSRVAGGAGRVIAGRHRWRRARAGGGPGWSVHRSRGPPGSRVAGHADRPALPGGRPEASAGRTPAPCPVREQPRAPSIRAAASLSNRLAVFCLMATGSVGVTRFRRRRGGVD